MHRSEWSIPALAACALAACADGGAGPGAAGDALPSTFYLVAEAVSGDTITCELNYVYTVQHPARIEGNLVEYRGSYGGEAYRAHLQADGSGEAFWADVAGNFLATVLPGDSLEVRYQGPTSPGSRFWDRQTLFAGRLGPSPHLASGVWDCEPLDVRSDTTGIARGTWRLQEESPWLGRAARR